MVFSPDGKRVAVASKEYVRVYDAGTGRPLAVLGPHEAPVYHLAYSPDGKRLASSTYTGPNAIHLWDRETGKQVAVLRDTYGFSPLSAFQPGRHPAAFVERLSG